jgi:tetratricopeptide (TPR) repeat protein
MKRTVLLMFALLATGCQRNFDELLVDSRSAYAEKNYTEVIDNMNLALPRWRNGNGADLKAEAYELLGKSYHALRKLDQASEAYREAIQLSNNVYDSAYALGIMSTASSQHEKAKEAYQAALRMKPNDPLALVGLGDSLYNLGRTNEAKAVYEKVLAVSPGVTNALANLRLIERGANRQSGRWRK